MYLDVHTTNVSIIMYLDVQIPLQTSLDGCTNPHFQNGSVQASNFWFEIGMLAGTWNLEKKSG